MKTYFYLTPKEASIYKNVPIQQLNEFLREIRKQNPLTKYRVMYRGPRRKALGDTRSDYSKQSGCLKQYATSFAVYIDTRKNG